MWYGIIPPMLVLCHTTWLTGRSLVHLVPKGQRSNERVWSICSWYGSIPHGASGLLIGPRHRNRHVTCGKRSIPLKESSFVGVKKAKLANWSHHCSGADFVFWMRQIGWKLHHYCRFPLRRKLRHGRPPMRRPTHGVLTAPVMVHYTDSVRFWLPQDSWRARTNLVLFCLMKEAMGLSQTEPDANTSCMRVLVCTTNGLTMGQRLARQCDEGEVIS